MVLLERIKGGPPLEEKHAVEKDPHGRHQRLWTVLRPLLRLICWIRLGFRAKQSGIKGPFLLLCNHVTDWDPVLAGCSFSQQMYFVASEHLLRQKVAGPLIRWAQDPIPRQKSGSAAGTVMSILRHLKKGHSVAFFPEGNRTWDGVTGDMLPTVGKLARTAGVKLVTYRLEGGYFTSPRWAGSSIRRGRMRGAVVRVYSPESLKAMTPDEINRHIREDLFEDAYARQRANPIRYRSRRGAEHMERLLFICPKCGMLHSLRSKNDTVRCWKCGFSFRWLPTGFLAGADLPFDNLRDWNRWQTEEIRRICAAAEPGKPIFTDTDVTTCRVEFARDQKSIAGGEMQLFSDRLEIPGAEIPLSGLTGMAIVQGQDLYVSTADATYLVRSQTVKCMTKYLTACSLLNPGANYGV